MKNLLSILISILLTTHVYSQSITFSFAGKNAITNSALAVDKIHIFNQTNGTDTIVNGNTFSILTTSVDITEINDNIITYPNPFYKELTIGFNSKFNEKVQVSVFTIEGKKISGWEGDIGIGHTKYLFKSGVEGLLLLSINSGNIQLRTKLICMERSNSSGITSLTNNSNSIKSARSSNSAFIFRLGDELKFIGYLGFIESEEIIDSPTGNSSYTLVFDVTEYIPAADFNLPNTNINKGSIVNFSDISTNSPSSWNWNFGDEGTSTLQNPSHIYLIPGTYDVSLTASNSYGSDTETKLNYITVNSLKPKAEFMAFVTTVSIGESISFYDQSTNSPTRWKWDFGDGNAGFIQNPNHLYNQSGLYTVTLIAENSFGSDTIIKSDYIEVIEEPALSVTPVSLDFGILTTQLPFDIQNSGTGTLTWSIMEEISWLVLSPVSGETTIETDQVSVDINRAGLAPGNYSDTITITSNGGNQDVEVLMEVVELSGIFIDSRDNYEYNWIRIGSQIWMAENLVYLPSVSPPSGESYADPFYYIYDYSGIDVAAAKATDNYTIYGALYNWPAALTACPGGWHLPTDAEWKQMEMFIGMSQSDADDIGWRGTDEGTLLKAISGWFNNGNGTDDYGFSGLPGGYRTSDGNFSSIGSLGLWWSATENSSDQAWYRSLYFDYFNFNRNYYNKEGGFSVRCVRD
ncbi:MAG: PKD domain-containing protein [Mariniphaga sp.]|nr:PKD domain-containing protein [Mariniphaga sp.]